MNDLTRRRVCSDAASAVAIQAPAARAGLQSARGEDDEVDVRAPAVRNLLQALPVDRDAALPGAAVLGLL